MAAIRLAFVTLISAAVLGGCASMSADECITADWRTIGFEDGARGKTADSIGRHRKACAKAGVTADQSRYEEGRQAGLRDFCQPAKGYDVGHRGDAYQGVCPSDLEDEFLRAYEEGRYLHGLEQAVRDVEQSLGRVDRNLKDTRDDLVAGEKQLIDGGGSRDERATIVDDNRELAERVGQLEIERDALLIELGERREQLRNYVR